MKTDLVMAKFRVFIAAVPLFYIFLASGLVGAMVTVCLLQSVTGIFLAWSVFGWCCGLLFAAEILRDEWNRGWRLCATMVIPACLLVGIMPLLLPVLVVMEGVAAVSEKE